MQEEQDINESADTQKVAVLQPFQLSGEPMNYTSLSVTENPGKNGKSHHGDDMAAQPSPADIVHEETSPGTAFSTIETPLPEAVPAVQPSLLPKKPSKKQLAPVKSSGKRDQDGAFARALRERCRQLCLSLFLRSRDPIRSLGFTSAVPGEGKTFLAQVTAGVLARDCNSPVILLECNWEHPNLHESFGFPATPGLAEWLRGECSVSAISHQINDSLSVILAGDAKGQAVRLLRQLRTRGLLDTIACDGEALIVDLPPIIVSGYGTLAAELVESLVVVVRAGVTPDVMIAETCNQLKDLPVHGLMLNQLQSRIPRWIRQLL